MQRNLTYFHFISRKCRSRETWLDGRDRRLWPILRFYIAYVCLTGWTAWAAWRSGRAQTDRPTDRPTGFTQLQRCHRQASEYLS